MQLLFLLAQHCVRLRRCDDKPCRHGAFRPAGETVKAATASQGDKAERAAPPPGRESMVALWYRRAYFPALCCVLHGVLQANRAPQALPVLPTVGGVSVPPAPGPGPLQPRHTWAWLGLLCTGRTVWSPCWLDKAALGQPVHQTLFCVAVSNNCSGLILSVSGYYGKFPEMELLVLNLSPCGWRPLWLPASRSFLMSE